MQQAIQIERTIFNSRFIHPFLHRQPCTSYPYVSPKTVLHNHLRPNPHHERPRKEPVQSEGMQSPSGSEKTPRETQTANHPLSSLATQFTAKQLNRQAAKASKDETAEKNKLKKVRPQPPPALPKHSSRANPIMLLPPTIDMILTQCRRSNKTTPTSPKSTPKTPSASAPNPSTSSASPPASTPSPPASKPP